MAIYQKNTQKMSRNASYPLLRCAVLLVSIAHLASAITVVNSAEQASAAAEAFISRRGQHTNNWAILVDTSRYWFNYRHIANTLSFYRTVKRLGIPDSHILLLLADDMACNPRNPFSAQVFNNRNRKLNLYGEDVEVDYRGYEVTVENFLRLLTGRHDPSVPRSKRLETDAGSNILVYMTGHGGDGFLKFQDHEELTSMDMANAIHQMNLKRRYNEILFVADTCQAATLSEQFYSPGVIAIGSSKRKENSYSHHADDSIGVAVIDRFTYHSLQFFESIQRDSRQSVQAMFDSFHADTLMSTPEWRSDLFGAPLHKTPIRDFISGDVKVRVNRNSYPILFNNQSNINSLPAAASTLSNPTEDTPSVESTGDISPSPSWSESIATRKEKHIRILSPDVALPMLLFGMIACVAKKFQHVTS